MINAGTPVKVGYNEIRDFLLVRAEKRGEKFKSLFGGRKIRVVFGMNPVSDVFTFNYMVAAIKDALQNFHGRV